MEKDAKPNLLPQWFPEILPFFLFKNFHGWAESLEVVLGHESTFSPDCQLFWLKHLSCLLTLASRLLAFERWAAEAELGSTQTESKGCPLGQERWRLQDGPASTSPDGLNSLDLSFLTGKWCQLHRVLSGLNKMTVPSPYLMNAQWKLSPFPFYGPTSIP